METYEAMKQIRYSNAFLYTYSRRKGTPAMRWADDVSEAVKDDRHKRLFDLHREVSSQLMQEMLGQEVEVLVEKRNKDAIT